MLAREIIKGSIHANSHVIIDYDNGFVAERIIKCKRKIEPPLSSFFSIVFSMFHKNVRMLEER